MSISNAVHCESCESNVVPYSLEEVRGHLVQHPGWELQATGWTITRDFVFQDFYHTMAFVNAVAWVANQEGHHPNLEIGPRHCRVSFQTHSVCGLTRNDFICAAKVDALIAAYQHGHYPQWSSQISLNS